MTGLKKLVNTETHPDTPVSFDEVLNALDISHPTLRSLIQEGKIRFHRVGRRKTYYFLSEVFEDAAFCKLYHI